MWQVKMMMRMVDIMINYKEHPPEYEWQRMIFRKLKSFQSQFWYSCSESLSKILFYGFEPETSFLMRQVALWKLMRNFEQLGEGDFEKCNEIRGK